MKKYIVISLCIAHALNCMEQAPQQIIKREPREWDAQAYADGNKMQAAANHHFLTSNNIQTKNLKILELGCGTGEQAAKLSANAQHVHAIDASKNMIEYAHNKYGTIKNLSFEHAFAEDFQSSQSYQLALALCCFHWFTDKKQALQQINNHLETNGQFFADIQTTSQPTPFTLLVFHEMMQDIPLIGEWLSKCADPTGNSLLTNDELDAILKETGFDNFTRKTQSFDWTATKEECKQWLWPIIASRPAVKYIPNMVIQPLFEQFFERCLKKLQNNSDGTYTWTYTTEIVHAYKK